MIPSEVGYISIVVLVILIFLGMPIGFAMAFVGIAGFAFLKGLIPGIELLKIVPYTTFASYNLSIIPLFILMGEFCYFSGISKDLYRAVNTWIGQLRGGLAIATVMACAGFAAISGSSVATAATMGSVALPEMKRYNYDRGLAAGSVAAGGTIGILIPPSVVLVLYGIITGQSIGKLFIAGFLPGLTQAILYAVTIYVMCKVNPKLGMHGAVTTSKEKLISFKDTWAVLALFLLVIGGIYAGIFTPTEAAGVGACGAFIITIFRRRLQWSNLKSSLITTIGTTAMIFIIITGAMILGYFFAVSRLPYELADIVTALKINRFIILASILFLYLFLGCIMDSMAIMLLVTPIFFPVILSLGFDPIWFGIMVTRVTEIGMITPPVGINVFVIQGVAKDIPMGTIFRGITPFLAADIVHVSLLIAVPQIALILPGLMR